MNDSFFDSADGSFYRVRLPSGPGAHEYSIRFRQDEFEKRHSGVFRAAD